MYIHMHIITISEKSGHGFEGEWGEVCARAWGEEKEGRYIIIL